MSSNQTLLPTGERRGGQECGDCVSCTANLTLLGPGEKGNCFFLRFWVPLAGEPVTEQNKKETKDSPPSPPSGEGVAQSPSPEEQDPKTPGRLSQGCRLPWRFCGREGCC